MSRFRWPWRRKAPSVSDHLPDALALEHRSLPIQARSTGYVLVLLILCFFAWAAVSHLDRIVVAPGKLVSLDPLIVVQPLESAIVRSLLFKSGDSVKKGDILARLDPTFVVADAAALRSRGISLQAQIDRLHAELEGGAPPVATNADLAAQDQLLVERQAEYNANVASLDEQIKKVEATIATNASNRQSLGARIELLQTIEDVRAKLSEKGFVSKVDWLQSRNETLVAEAQLAELLGQSRELDHELSSAEAKRLSFAKEWRRKAEEELIDAERQRSVVAEDLTKAERKASLSELVSPADGTVLEVAHRSIGSVLQPAEPLFTIVPANAKLDAEVEIDAADIGSVRLGSEVRVKMDAFPFQRYGTLAGALKVISPDAFRRDAPAAGAYFRGTVDLASLHLDGLGADSRLTPGMTVTAEIHAGEQSLLAYISYPIIRVFDEGLREPR